MVISTHELTRISLKTLYPFQPHYLDRNGLAYHYLDEGQGEPILMLHGNPTWSFYFRELVKAFAPDYRVVVPDHIGCGRSDKPGPKRYDFRLRSRVADLDALISHLNLDQKITLIIHDWGGMIGLTWALNHMEQIRRIVVLNTSGFLPPSGKPIPIILKLIRNVPLFGVPAILGLNLFVQGALWRCAHKPLKAAVKSGLAAPYRRPKDRLATLKFVQDIPMVPTDPSYAMVASTDQNLYRLQQIPMLILWGAHDFVFDQDYYNEWQRRFPHAHAHYLHDAGHYLLEDAPLTCIALIRGFFRRYP